MSIEEIPPYDWFNRHIKEIDELLSDGNELMTSENDKSAKWRGWHKRCLLTIDNYLRGIKVNIDKNPIYVEIENAFRSGNNEQGMLIETEKILEQLQSLKKIIELKMETSQVLTISQNPIDKLNSICQNFQRSLFILRSKDLINTTGWKEKQYQVLLHSLLINSFNDVRREEPNPSHGEGYTISDFYLKDEEICIELKIASGNKDPKDIRKEISDDIQSYSANPSCKLLYFFIYQESIIFDNPGGFESDFDKENVVVKVFPKG